MLRPSPAAAPLALLPVTQHRGSSNSGFVADTTLVEEDTKYALADVTLAELLSPRPAIPRPPPHSRHISSHSQQSLAESNHRNSWALTDQSHAAQTSESHPSKRPLLGRSRSSGVGTEMHTAPRRRAQPDEFGARRISTRSSSWDEDAHRRRARFQSLKVGLELFIAAWAAYSSIRHFLGYTLYTSALDRRIISLVLGSLSLASLFLSIGSLFSVTLSPSPPPFYLGPLLEVVLALFLITPPIVSFALVFLWKHASEPNKTLEGRCSWDIDVIWTGTGSQCTHGPPWAVFIAASSVRLALTLIVLAMYLYVSASFRRTPRPLRRSKRDRPDSDAQTSTGGGPSRDSRAQLLSFAQRGSGTPVTMAGGARNSPRHLLAEEFTPPTTPSGPSSNMNMNMGYVDTNPQPLSSPSYPPAPHPVSSHPYSMHPSNENDNEPLPSPSDSSDPDQAAAAIAARLARRTADMELIQFAAQFRSLVHQMQRDVAAGALLPSAGGTASSSGTPSEDGMTPRSDDGREDYGFPNMNQYGGNNIAGPSGGYAGQWQWQGPGPSPLAVQLATGTGPAQRLPPEEREQMRLVLGRLVRRMPTIESLGSREGTASVRAPYSASASRPPTRLTMRSTDCGSVSSASAAPSRSNSLTLGRVVGQAPLPTPPSPVMLDGYFSGRASPGASSMLSRGAAAQAPSRPPTPTDMSYPASVEGLSTATGTGTTNSSAGHSPALGSWSLSHPQP